MKPIVDSHLDLAWNAASFDRDLTLSLKEMNACEAGMTDCHFRGNATVSFSEMRKGNIFLSLATVLVRSGPQQKRQAAYKRTDLDFPHRVGAYAAGYAQLACYRLWEQQGHLKMIRTKQDFDEHLSYWQTAWQTKNEKTSLPPLGVILSMEGADPIVQPDQLQEWYDAGLRAIGPAHYGFSQYAGGTAVEGGLTQAGRQLLQKMQMLNMALDVTHLCDQSMEEALDLFEGVTWASHHNSRTLVPRDRQLPDFLMQKLIDRGAVIGVCCDAWMLHADWVHLKTLPEEIGLTIESLADQIDYICQMAGNTDHAAIGSDLDGGFGTEQTPSDLKSIADLQNLIPILEKRGYTDEDIDKIFHQNWLQQFRTVLPD